MSIEGKLNLRALLSVSDRRGLVEFARNLSDLGVKLVSTGGTMRELANAGLKVKQVSEMTGFPEILDGRVKTLHPAIHGGILARRNVLNHVAEINEHGIELLDIVVNNLYPFARTVSRDDVTLEEALEQIDIGGPAMTRAAAKNFPHVVVVVDPDDYSWVGEKLANGGISLNDRRHLAAKAFSYMSNYDASIGSYLGNVLDDVPFPDELITGWRLVKKLRYGENSHQQGAIYQVPDVAKGLAHASQLHGIDMSYVNYLDADAAWLAANSFERHAVSVVKHANPCGLAINDDQTEAWRRAFAGDPVSAYGGIVGFNSTLTVKTADAMKGIMLDVVVAPGYTDEALELLQRRKQTRLLRVDQGPKHALITHPISGGILAQTPDVVEEDSACWRVVSERLPSAEELSDLSFAWKACQLIKSNAIVLANNNAIIGMGAGQPNRVTSVHLATRVAGDQADGTVLASDAFFPFADGIQVAGQAGVRAIVQPGGSIRDEDAIAAADRFDMAMVFTGKRHFLH